MLVSEILDALLSSEKKSFSSLTSALSLWIFYFFFFPFTKERGKVCRLKKNQLLTNDLFWGLLNIHLYFILLIPHFSKIMEPVMKVDLKNTFSNISY